MGGNSLPETLHKTFLVIETEVQAFVNPHALSPLTPKAVIQGRPKESEHEAASFLNKNLLFTLLGLSYIQAGPNPHRGLTRNGLNICISLT